MVIKSLMYRIIATCTKLLFLAGTTVEIDMTTMMGRSGISSRSGEGLGDIYDKFKNFDWDMIKAKQHAQ